MNRLMVGPILVELGRPATPAPF